MRFKTDRVKAEFEKLAELNSKLHALLLKLDTFCLTVMGKDVCLTHIFRTEEEQKQLYAATPIDKRPKSSPHQVWGACDVRSRDFNKEQIEQILDFLVAQPKGRYRTNAIYHKIPGNTDHLHLQY